MTKHDDDYHEELAREYDEATRRVRRGFIVGLIGYIIAALAFIGSILTIIFHRK
jgi:hypothetical protein